MKEKSIRILVSIVFFICVTINVNKVYASEASISANNCNVGENFTVTVNIPQDAISYEGTITVTYSDGSTDSGKILGLGQNLNDIMSDYYWPGNASKTFTAKTAGNATVSVTGLIMNNASGSKINSQSTLTTAITIGGGQTQPPANNQTSEPSNNSGNQGGTTQKPTTPTNLTFKDTNEKMYTTRRVNMRQGYGTNSLIIQTLPEKAELTRTGVSSGSADGYSWSRVSYNGITGYVITGALTYDAPVTEEPKKEDPQEDPEDELPPEDVDENAEEIKKITEELGSIPEVGLNIMPFIFLGSIISCLYMVYEVKKSNGR